jgi:hypothetical protein
MALREALAAVGAGAEEDVIAGCCPGRIEKAEAMVVVAAVAAAEAGSYIDDSAAEDDFRTADTVVQHAGAGKLVDDINRRHRVGYLIDLNYHNPFVVAVCGVTLFVLCSFAALVLVVAGPKMVEEKVPGSEFVLAGWLPLVHCSTHC